MGRDNALDRLGLTPEDLVDLYNQTPFITTLSEDTGVSVRALKRHLKAAGLTGPWRYPPRKRKRHVSGMAEWIRQNPHTTLPPSVPEICRITGLSRFVVHHYLYRRQERYMRFVKENWRTFLKVHQKNLIFRIGEKVIPIHALQRTYLTIDKFTLKIRVQFQLKDGLHRVFFVSAGYFNKVIEQEKQEQEQEGL